MARYRTIATRMWTDEKFQRLSPLAPSGQALWLYLLLAPETTIIPGLYRAGEAALAEGLRWSVKDFRKAFEEVCREGLAEADWDARLVWIPNAVRYNPPQSPNVVKAWATAWVELPECALKIQAAQSLRGYLKAFGQAFQVVFEQAIGKDLPESGPGPGAGTLPPPTPSKGVSAVRVTIEECDQLITCWNNFAKHMKVAEALDFDKSAQSRRTAVTRAIRDGRDVTALRAALNIAHRSPFIRKQVQEGKSWFSFDWVLKPGNFQKLIEGKYGGKPGKEADPQLVQQHVRVRGIKELHHAGYQGIPRGTERAIAAEQGSRAGHAGSDSGEPGELRPDQGIPKA